MRWINDRALSQLKLSTTKWPIWPPRRVYKILLWARQNQVFCWFLIPLLLTSLRSALLLHCLLKVLRSGEPKQKCLQLSVSNEIFLDLYLWQKSILLAPVFVKRTQNRAVSFMVIIIMYLQELKLLVFIILSNKRNSDKADGHYCTFALI